MPKYYGIRKNKIAGWFRCSKRGRAELQELAQRSGYDTYVELTPKGASLLMCLDEV